MPKTKREFSPEFKRETVALLEASRRPLMQVATEVGISPSMLRNWRTVMRGGSARSRAAMPMPMPMPSPADQALEIARLKRELDRTCMERDVLKKRSASMDFGLRGNDRIPWSLPNVDRSQVLTERQLAKGRADPAKFAADLDRQVLKAHLEPVDVAETIPWLAVGESRLCTAHIWFVDAGAACG